MGAALKYENLVVEYNSRSGIKRAVDQVSFSVEEGELFSLLGPNGAGKTSMISATTSLIPYQGGKIEILGHRAGSTEAKRSLGIVPQELVGYGFFTVNEILGFASGYFGFSNNQKHIDSLLEKLQLTNHRDQLVSQLSGGMKRRMLIAKALVHRPKVLLLDEPSAGVDVELRTILWDYVKELNKAGMTIILTTHYLEEAERLCERTAILDHGKLISLDKTRAIIERSDSGSLEAAFLKLLKDGKKS